MNIKLTPQTLSALLNLNIITNTTPKGHFYETNKIYKSY